MATAATSGWSRSRWAVPGTRSATADFNGDDIDDAAVVANNGLRVCSSAAHRHRRAAKVSVASDPASANPAGYYRYLIAGDLDGDGDSDLGALGFPLGSVKEYVVIAGDGDGGFAPAVTESYVVSQWLLITGLAAGDVDGDGDLEAILSAAPAFAETGLIAVHGDDSDDDFAAETSLVASVASTPATSTVTA